MEPGMSMETCREIRVAVLPIGGEIPPQTLRSYISMLYSHRRVDLSSISSFYVEHQKSPFAHQPWDTGSLRLKFVIGGDAASPWEDFQSNRKILAVIGICHCPSSPDLVEVSEEFARECGGYKSALVQRCFAFCPSDAQLEGGGDKGNNLKLFPPSDRRSQEFHMQTMLQDLAASLLMEFERWVLHAESAGTILKTPLDSQASLSSEEVIKAKKKRLGRAQKTIGDYCLLAGSPIDANAHYATAIELARLTGDVFWHAGALEGSACALLVDREDHRDPVVEEEVKYRYYSVIQLYRRTYIPENAQRVSTVSFELEAALKLARYLCRRELAKDVVDLLMAAADGAKSLIDANDRLILYIEVARLFGKLGYHRKAAFFSRLVAQLYLQQENTCAALSAMKVLSMTTKAYRVQSKGESPNSSVLPDELESSHPDNGKLHPQSIVSLFESQWSTLQMVVLREILLSSVRAGDPLTAWSAASRLLRSYYPLIAPAGQSGLASSLSSSAERLPPGTRCADPALPFIRLHSFPVHPAQADIIKCNPNKEGWWTGSAPSGPFIYTPFSKSGSNENIKQEVTWIVGEPVEVLVELANPCGFDLVVDSIYLSVHSGNFDPFPVHVDLPPNSAKVISLSGIPIKVGSVMIPGCIVHCFGVITEHLFKDVDNLLLGATQGLVLSDPFRCCGSGKLKTVTLPSISIVPPLPLLVSHIVGGDGSAVLYEGEICDIRISLANAGSVPVEQAYVSLSGKNQDAILSIADEVLRSSLPLKPGAEVTLPVTLKAWQLGLADSDLNSGKNAFTNSTRISKEGTVPMLVIHYAGPSTSLDNTKTDESFIPPGRRLIVPLHVCVLQGLRFVKARLLSMDIPAHVSETLPDPVKLVAGSNDETSTDKQTERLVKIDPYKGSWGLRLLELELSNPTDVAFEVNVFVHLEKPKKANNANNEDFCCSRTRIDRDYSSRVLIPLEHFKLPVIDDSFFSKDLRADDASTSKLSTISERSCKAELNALINNLISKIRVQWQSGRNSSGELNIKDAIQAALQTSIIDVLLPDPLTFGFRLSSNKPGSKHFNSQKMSREQFDCSGEEPSCRSKGSVLTHDMTPIEALIRNNTKETIKMNLSISCRDIAGENCVEGKKPTVLWAGVLTGVTMEVPPLQEIIHPFSLYFLVPGEYTLLGAAVIDETTDMLRARARTSSPDEPIFCRGSPFRIQGQYIFCYCDRQIQGQLANQQASEIGRTVGHWMNSFTGGFEFQSSCTAMSFLVLHVLIKKYILDLSIMLWSEFHPWEPDRIELGEVMGIIVSQSTGELGTQLRDSLRNKGTN